ncbi:glucuronate isomerase [Psychromicrobium lacuslunae]|uniref:Uronate isomerase n=1 Tax=Psychromicrobium lacuslunae TaxID=1618207 RepID=A0A0D4C2A0_9MICC|nr:glucuronate isomerase [Psychromicrobium lacuslunae]AJT42510.1 glucuronate isomerase [Psychromicrobium lacuslunae]
MSSIALDPDRLFPVDPALRQLARELHQLVADLPILSPHGHVPAELLLNNQPFGDPASLLISPDHYVTRLMHASGIGLDELGVAGTQAEPREIWRRFCAAWSIFDGTASGYWLRSELVSVFGLDEAELAPERADHLFDQLSAKLATAEFRPRALFDSFGIEVLATTDDPLDSLADHQALAADPGFSGRVLPTFRPDSYLNASAPGFAERVDRLISEAGDGLVGYAGYLRALQNRRAHFIESGAVSADHGVRTPSTLRLDQAEAARLFEAAIRGGLSQQDRDAFEAQMIYQMARMSVEDGLVMTLHPGSWRDHHQPTFNRFGADTGHDIPFPVSYTEGLRALLNDFGTSPGFHLVLFTLDETTFSRELAPLAGFYPSVFLGAPWWFLDAPDAMLRFRSAVTETAGFSRSAGFVDDTRAFCSIPARHDASRRVEAAFLARLVAERRVTEERAAEIIVDLVDAAPRRVFKLGASAGKSPS